MNLLEQLKQITEVVADTGDFESIRSYKPIDATTNPSLIYAAAQKPEYRHLIDNAVDFGKKNGRDKIEKLTNTMDKLSVNFGIEILKVQ